MHGALVKADLWINKCVMFKLPYLFTCLVVVAILSTAHATRQASPETLQSKPPVVVDRISGKIITHKETPWLNDKHSIFGQVTKGQEVVDAIRKGATINQIEVLDSTDALFAQQQQRITQWNDTLSTQGF